MLEVHGDPRADHRLNLAETPIQLVRVTDEAAWGRKQETGFHV